MIHAYRYKEKNIVLDVESGAVHIVSDLVFALLKNEPTDAYSDAEVAQAKAEIEYLKKEGLLGAPPTPEAIASPEHRNPVIKAICLHAAHDCNMRCGYCFADEGGYAGTRSLMPIETAKNAVDFLLKNSGDRKLLELDFFGGEPLMNFGMVKELTAYIKEEEKKYGKHIRLTMTTNALLLDEEKAKFIDEHMDNVILSIDGRPEVNDKMRKTVSGEGTYKYIIDNITAFAKRRGGRLYYVRGTYTAYNKDFANDIEHLANLGLKNISLEPAVTSEDCEYALKEEDLSQLYAEYDRLADIMKEREKAGNPISFFHFNVDLNQGPCVFKRCAGCGAGTEYAAVTPEGDIYPCHQFAGEKDYNTGNVNEIANGAEFKNKLFETFNQAHIFSKEDCRTCWAKYYCSGGCHANAIHYEGTIKTPHKLSCAIEKKRLETAISLICD
jgi:uncharacterized protein